MTYEQALNYIHSICWRGSRPGLSRITQLLDRLGNPQRTLRVIHVAGTNGKGSFCAMLEGVLRHSGYRTGLFISPYLTDFTERIQLDGRPIDRLALARLTQEIRPLAENMDDPPTEFELITALALVHFARSGCQLVVLETGMGGRLDSTNVVSRPLLSVITGVARDHMAFLGATIPEIAREKAGIIKAGRPVLWGGEDMRALSVIQRAAKHLAAPLTQCDYSRLKDVRCTLEGAHFRFGDQSYALPLLGLYQPKNAALVLTALELLRQEGLVLPQAAVRQALASARWPGRFERLRAEPTVFFDGAHNVQGVTATVQSIRHYYPGQPVLVLCGLMADKEVAAMTAQIAPVARQVFAITPDNPRALPAPQLAGYFRDAGVPTDSFDRVDAALAAACEAARQSGLPLFCLGSLYSYGEICRALARLDPGL